MEEIPVRARHGMDAAGWAEGGSFVVAGGRAPAPSARDKWPGRRVLDYDDALRRAVRVFVRDGRLDMDALAEEIPVGRATLYRVVGSRDRLLGDVLWTLAERTLALSELEATGTGLDRLVRISRRFKEHTLDFPPFRAFLRAEPETAFRVLLTPAGRVSERMVAAWIDLFRAAIVRGELSLPFDVEWFAYVFVRTGESMVYSDMLAGREPDLELAEVVQTLLFRERRSGRARGR